MRASSRSSRTGVALAAAVLGTTALYTGPLLAQNAMSVPEIRACLCEEQAMETLRQRNAGAKAVYDERAAREQRLSDQIDSLRYSMNPNDLAAQDQLRELIDLRARVAQDRRDYALPAWQAATKRLSDMVADYNSKCAGRPIYKTDDEQARQNLICPATP